MLSRGLWNWAKSLETLPAINCGRAVRPALGKRPEIKFTLCFQEVGTRIGFVREIARLAFGGPRRVAFATPRDPDLQRLRSNVFLTERIIVPGPTKVYILIATAP
jgi:hypothetical protein